VLLYICPVLIHYALAVSHRCGWRDSGMMIRASALRRRLPELLLTAVSCLFVLGVLASLESWLRLRTGGAPDAVVDLARLHRYSETLGWEPRPLARYCESGVCTSINERGYRGRLVGANGGSTPRVLILGDSVAFGLGVGDDDTFSHRLAQDGSLQTFNLAVQGYGPDQSLIRMEQEGLALRPDVVIMNFCLDNDFADTAVDTFLYGPQPKPYFVLSRGELLKHDDHLRIGPTERMALWLEERSLLLRHVQSLTATLGRGRPIHWRERMRLALEERPERIATTFAILRRMSDRAEAAGAAFLLVVHPTGPAYRSGSPWLAAFSSSPLLDRISVLSLREPYRAQGLRFREISMDRGGHLTPLGHRVAAEVIGTALREIRRQRDARSRAGRPAALGETAQQLGPGLGVGGPRPRA